MAGPSGPPAPRRTLRWAFFWGVVIGGLGLFDWWRAGKHDGSTLSEVIRALFRTDTPQGRRAFLALYSQGTRTLASHIIKE